MPDANTLHCSLITPDEHVLDCDATMVVIPAHDGLIGFLKNRAPLLCKLGSGEMRVESASGNKKYRLEGGFAQMLDNTLTVLTERVNAVDK